MYLDHLIISIPDQGSYICPPDVSINYELILKISNIPFILLIAFSVVYEAVLVKLAIVLVA